MTGNALQVIRWLSSQDQEQEWEIKKYRKRRSLSQNSYYWQLLTKVADVKRLSKTVVHNMMLRDYGQPYGVDGRLVAVTIPDTEKAEQQTLAAETFHLKPTSQVKLGTKNQMFRTYVMIRGSSTYNTKEMSILLDGLIQEAQNLGIETLTPAELEEIRQYEQEHNR